MKQVRWFVWLWCSLFCMAAEAFAAPDFLSVEQAFHLSTHLEKKPAALRINFAIAPDCYLYRDRIHVRAIATDKVTLGEPTFPPSNKTLSDGKQTYAAYKGTVDIRWPIQQTQVQPFVVEISYQGCAEAGICYPPVTQRLEINPLTQAVTAQAASDALTRSVALPKQMRLQQMLQEENILKIIFSFFGLGLLLAFTPCVLPMIPIISGIITEQKSLTTGKAFRLSLTYVLSMSVTYALLGIGMGVIGSGLQAVLQSVWVLSLFSLMLVLLALSLFGLYELQLPRVVRQHIHGLSLRQKSNYVGVASMGVLATLVVSPCVSAPLVAALGYISQTGNAAMGGVALFSLGLGMGLPLLIVGTTEGKLLPRSGPWMHAVKNFFGILLLAMSIWMLSRVIPVALQMLLWGMLCIGCGVYLGALNNNKKGWPQLWQSVGIVLLTYGILLLIGASTGHRNPLQPLMKATVDTQQSQVREVSSRDELVEQLEHAHGRLTLLDVYADWCIECKKLEEHIFTLPKIERMLSAVQVLRLDITHLTPDKDAVLRQFAVVAPPTLLFFDREGKEITDARLVGGIDASTLGAQLQKIN